MFKQIPNYENFLINEEGVVKAPDGHILSQNDNGKGYRTVSLNRQSKYVHRLVAQTFLPNPDNLPCVDHIDTDKSNNNVSNLRWCSYKTNNTNPITQEKGKLTRQTPEFKERMKKMGAAMSGANNPANTHPESNIFRNNNPQPKKLVICIETGVIYESACEASKATGICRSHINSVCNKKPRHNTAGGFHWEFYLI